MNKKKANALKNKARKKELYTLLIKAERAKNKYDSPTSRSIYSVGPYDGWRDFMSTDIKIVMDGNIIGVSHDPFRGTYHWTAAIPTDAQMTKLRLYG